ncbi:NagC family transcriptional regulator [Natrinema mahii]|uniref:Nascent polypeptide-associated complex protein n=1 Tax=Natrinema pellirubrum (strain DSM 15624 / CIP 106293 / JCM 10476 / NCIMB 786 / 157) TaxID=797303 RepID=L0JNB0_NATP1|nr:nascent polypeptide-associated complex protein [Natrinema pellirubrum]AGB33020.1 alpha-NAC-related protein [Natrinema pellirubrum DSM 15624]ELY75124.1 nascent polypeptide-associated complex protein [Natrinema pellirubrum DSM 15624]OAQ51758.1 NagC family transcriptional regulator [Natrinema mahii]
MFGGGGGGLNPRKMEQMMEQMGIDVEDIDAEEVIIRTDEYDLVFDDAEVTKMDARGQETYQVIGSPEEVEAGSAGGSADAGGDAGSSIPDEDVELVATRAGVSEDEAREALEDADGDLAAAVESLE